MVKAVSAWQVALFLAPVIGEMSLELSIDDKEELKRDDAGSVLFGAKKIPLNAGGEDKSIADELL